MKRKPWLMPRKQRKMQKIKELQMKKRPKKIRNVKIRKKELPRRRKLKQSLMMYIKKSLLK
jgi:hypothetical protein